MLQNDLRSLDLYTTRHKEASCYGNRSFESRQTSRTKRGHPISIRNTLILSNPRSKDLASVWWTKRIATLPFSIFPCKLGLFKGSTRSIHHRYHPTSSGFHDGHHGHGGHDKKLLFSFSFSVLIYWQPHLV